jgi:nuclear RNA export factor
MSLNNRALHDSNQQQTQPHEWDGYIKQSRNLKHITHLPARVNRQFKGTDAIRKIFSTLPATQHPSFAEFPQKWCIESHSVPGLPDPSGQSPTGVQGFSIIIHGEFEEVGSKKRSFDRTFIIGPGPTKPSGVAVVSDCLVVRGYGGYTAWEPEVQNSAPSMDGQAQMSDQEKVFAVMQVTGLTAQYAEMALMENGGDIQGAVAAFEAAKSQGVLPPDAFAQ